jgi:hypothetical protein
VRTACARDRERKFAPRSTRRNPATVAETEALPRLPDGPYVPGA